MRREAEKISIFFFHLLRCSLPEQFVISEMIKYGES